jgi:hypothetical protein
MATITSVTDVLGKGFVRPLSYSFKMNKDAEESHRITVNVDFEGCTILDILNMCLNPSGIPVRLQARNRNGNGPVNGQTVRVKEYFGTRGTADPRLTTLGTLRGMLSKEKDPAVRAHLEGTIRALEMQIASEQDSGEEGA